MPTGSKVRRHTVRVDGPLALWTERLRAAQERAFGREILTMPVLGARLVRCFVELAGKDVLYPLIQTELNEGEFTEIGRVADSWSCDSAKPLRVGNVTRTADF